MAHGGSHSHDDSSLDSENLLDEGELVAGRFIVLRKLQSGSFGQVYAATDSKQIDVTVAIKVEKPRPIGKRSFCAHEADIMKKYQGKNHAPAFYLYGSTPPYLFIAMQMMSFTLSELRRCCPSKSSLRFSISTTTRVAIECLAALRELHEIGVIHRDIKPSNFMMGASKPNRHTVYLVDFGLSRFFKHANGDIIPARQRPGFVGSTRYASPGAHDGHELGRGDDLFSLFYTLVELRKGRLPWRCAGDRRTVGRLKRQMSNTHLCSGFAPQMIPFVEHVAILGYPDQPDYAKLHGCLEAIVVARKIKHDDPYDWDENFVKVLREDADGSSDVQSRSCSTTTSTP